MESTLTISTRRCINTKTAKRHHYQFTSHRTMSKQIDDIPLARRRVIATELLLKGESISEVSRKARLSLPTVSKYKDLIERGGPEALARLRIHGNIPRLDDASQSWLVSAIKHSPEIFKLVVASTNKYQAAFLSWLLRCDVTSCSLMRSGFRCTVSTRCQLRVGPFHRNGLRCLAVS
jgi:hypothetical protein